MSASAVRARIEHDMKAALKGGDKRRLGALRLMLAAIQQREIDARTRLDDAGVMAVLDKMAKQRRDAEAQYREAGREDLAEQERFELAVIADYLPEPLSGEALDRLVEAAVAEAGAASMRDMGRVMALLRPQVQGRADMGEVSARVKARLGG
ncbi:GatB/YqeY domain-containing protein [Inmirania thermothiophila]|uniref:Glutamyl-tRNA amidotransferase n=1 Tax=Inmirania thermothiophila TaxID=1750597 RepID=A0A3N1Y5V1_9GAMM|nr:GatB/YqeY domain-containing protein [Inmirania thermothiophila]ROR34183.1 hypothetical protein EDC57_0078 [Inmirania thermothiophila]